MGRKRKSAPIPSLRFCRSRDSDELMIQQVVHRFLQDWRDEFLDVRCEVSNQNPLASDEEALSS